MTIPLVLQHGRPATRVIVPSICLHLYRLLWAAVLIPVLSPVRIEAQGIQQKGTISGSISNASTHEFIGNARVSIENTQLVAVTDRDGSYSFSDLAPGKYTLVVNYSSLDEARRTITIEPGAIQRADFNLESLSAIVLSDFVVSAEAEGDAKAVNRQKNSNTPIEIIASDKFGNVTEGNVGEFLKNLPGMQINYVAADARTVSIRGQSDNFTNVTMDGNHIAQAASSLGSVNRNFEFEQLNIQNIESIEVSKVPTPAMSPAIGGTVNLISKSAFDQQGRRMGASLSLNANSEAFTLEPTAGPPASHKTYKIIPGGTLIYSEPLLNHRLGVAFNFSDSNQWNPQHAHQHRFFYPATPASATPLATASVTQDSPVFIGGGGSIDINNVGKITNRKDMGLNLDFRLTPTTTLRLYNNYSYYFTKAIQMDLNVNTAPISAQAGASLDGVVYAQDAGNGVTQSAGNFDKYTIGYGNYFSVTHKWRNWKIDYGIGYSKSINHYRDLDDGLVKAVTGGGGGQSTTFLNNLGLNITAPPKSALPTVFTQTAGPDIYDLNNYTAVGFLSDRRSSSDLIGNGKASVRRTFDELKYPLFIEVGFAEDIDARRNLNYTRRFNYVGTDGSGTPGSTPWQLGQFASNYGSVYGVTALRRIPWIDYYKVADYYNKHPNQFQEDQVNSYIGLRVNQKFIIETQQAAYVMGNTTIGKLNILGGLRFENTIDDSQGPSSHPPLASTGLVPGTLPYVQAQYAQVAKQKVSYQPPVFKNLQLKYTPLNNVNLFASYYDGEARQNFGDLIPNTSINDAGGNTLGGNGGFGTVTVVNTGLKPQIAKNYELDAEYFTKPAGVISVAWFQKDIKDFIVNSPATQVGTGPDNGFGGLYPGYDLITKSNAGDGHYKGIEINATHQFNYLPGALSGFTTGGSFTYIYSMSGNFGTNTVIAGRPTLVKILPGIIPKLYNVRLGYHTPNGKFFIEARENVRGRFLNTAAINNAQPTYLDRYNEQWAQLDMTMRYYFTSNLNLELSGRNILRAPTIITQGAGRFYIWSDYGAQYNLTLTARY